MNDTFQYSLIHESVNNVIESVGLNSIPPTPERIRELVTEECAKHGDPEEVVAAVAKTVEVRFDQAHARMRRTKGLKAVVTDELPEPLSMTGGSYEHAFPYPVRRIDEVFRVLDEAERCRQVGGRRALLIAAARTRLREGVHYRDASKGQDMVLVNATNDEHGTLRLAGIEGKL